MVGGRWARRIDAAVLDADANVRVRLLVSASAAVFAIFLLLVGLVAGVLSLVRLYAPGLVVAAVVLVVALGLGAAAALGLRRRS